MGTGLGRPLGRRREGSPPVGDYTIDRIDPPETASEDEFEQLVAGVVAQAVNHGLNRRSNVVESRLLRGSGQNGRRIYLWLNAWQGVGTFRPALQDVVGQLVAAGATVSPVLRGTEGEWDEVAHQARDG